MPSYEVGCEVLLRNSREDSRKGSKLYDPWRGPYLIVDVSSKGLYRLQDKDTGHYVKLP